MPVSWVPDRADTAPPAQVSENGKAGKGRESLLPWVHWNEMDFREGVRFPLREEAPDHLTQSEPGPPGSQETSRPGLVAGPNPDLLRGLVLPFPLHQISLHPFSFHTPEDNIVEGSKHTTGQAFS